MTPPHSYKAQIRQYFFLKWANFGLFFVYFRFTEKRIRTRIVGVEEKHPDHLTTKSLNSLNVFIYDWGVWNEAELTTSRFKTPANK